MGVDEFETVQEDIMTVRGTRVVHCHGKKKGRTIPGGTHKTHAQAVKQHRAIMANKKKTS
jgi:hypothetical protein